MAIGLIYVACRKTDTSPEKPVEKAEASLSKFFGEHSPSNPTVKKIMDIIVRENKKDNFVDGIIEKVGYPYWDKTLVYKTSAATGRGNTGDSTEYCYIPFVRDSANVVNALLVFKVSPEDTVFKWQCDWQYYDTTYWGISKKQSVGLMLRSDYEVFGNRNYEITDSTIFGMKRINFHLTSMSARQATTAGRSLLSEWVEICTESQAPQYGWLTGCPPGDPCNPYVTHWDCITYFFGSSGGGSTIYSTVQWTSTTPAAGSGASGGGWTPPSSPNSPCGGNGARGYVLPGCTPGYTPSITAPIALFKIDSIINNFTNPCIVAAKNKIPNFNLNIFAKSLYFAPLSQSYNWKIIFEENAALNINGTPIPAESFAVTPNKEWHVVLNPLFWEQPTQPNATQEIAGLNILHEIVHGFIRVYKDHFNLTVLNNVTTHEVIFKNCINAMSGALQNSFGMTPSDAKALAIQGLDDVLKKEYTAAGTLASYNTDYNSFAILNYGVSIPASNTVFNQYLAGTKGVKCF